MTVKEVYEKAQGIEATIALLQKLEGTIAGASTPAALMSELHRLDYGFLHNAYDFLQEYADKLYDTSACA